MKKIRNGRKKTKITSTQTPPQQQCQKSDEHQYCSKNAATPGTASFTLSTQGSYKLGGDSVVYTSKSDGSAFFHCLVGERSLGFFKIDFYGFRRSLITDEGKRNLL